MFKKHILWIVLVIMMLAPALVHAMPAVAEIDPDLATQAYIDAMKKAARAKSDSYVEGGYWLVLWGTVVTVLSSWILLRFGWSAKFRDWAERITKRRWLVPGLYALPYTAASTLLVFPWAVYSRYLRENLYGLMNQSFGMWITTQMIGYSFILLFSIMIFTAVFAVIRSSPKYWWLWGAATLSAFLVLAVLTMPIFHTQVYNESIELPAGPIRDKIISLAKANGVPHEHIYLLKQEKTHGRPFIDILGIGPTSAIILNDIFLNQHTEQEISAMVAHEMGHYVLGHNIRIMILLMLIFFGFSFLIYRFTPKILQRWGASWGVRDNSDCSIFPLYAIIYSIFYLLMTPINNTLLRENEREADLFGLNAARDPDAFAGIVVIYSESRKIEPGPIEEFLFFEHPSARKRIYMAMQWKEDHLPKIRPKSGDDR